VKVGDQVQKKHGYKWPGIIIAMFETLAGEIRVVVDVPSRK
jgi:hypothetical protein